MRRAVCTAMVGVLLGAVLSATSVTGVGSAAAADENPTVERVLIVSLPRTTWESVVDQRLPALRALLERSTVASLSVRTVGARTALARGYATIGAGNRATTEDASAGLALHRDTPFEGGSAADVYVRRAAIVPSGDVLHMAIARLRARNDALLYGAQPGALGTALADAGRTTAVVANADTANNGDPHTLRREAALAVMDEEGQVDGGEVRQELLAVDATAPYGLRFEEAAVRRAFDAAWRAHDLVLLEASDLERVDQYTPLALPEAQRRGTERALESADRLLDHALESVDLDRHLVIVVSPAAPRSGEELTVFAMAGPGIEPGLAQSGSTRRPGYVTLPDIAPTVLDRMGLDIADSMTGAVIASRGGGRVDDDRLEALAAQSETATFRDRATGPASVAFVVFQVLIYALAVVAIVRRSRRFADAVAFGALVVLAVPTVGFLSGLVRYDRLSVGGYVVALLAGSVALAAGVFVGTRAVTAGRPTHRPLVAPVALIALLFVVLLVDVVVGGPLQIDTVFGYSPIVAGRFAGYGNISFALVGTCAVVVATALWALLRRGDGGGGARRPLAVATVVLAVAVVVDGHPAWGSDVGGVLALVPAYAVVVLLLAGIRVDVRRLVLIAIGTVVTLAVFAAADLARPPESRTHLGRLVARTFDGSGEGVTTVVVRKLSTNLNILTSSVWTLIIPVALAFLAFLTWRSTGFLRPLQARVPGLRACLIGSLLVGGLGFAVNDSGVVVPAMMFAVLLPYLTYLVLRTEPSLRPEASLPPRRVDG